MLWILVILLIELYINIIYYNSIFLLLLISVFVRQKSDSGVIRTGVTYFTLYEWAPDRLIEIHWTSLSHLWPSQHSSCDTNNKTQLQLYTVSRMLSVCLETQPETFTYQCKYYLRFSRQHNLKVLVMYQLSMRNELKRRHIITFTVQIYNKTRHKLS